MNYRFLLINLICIAIIRLSLAPLDIHFATSLFAIVAEKKKNISSQLRVRKTIAIEKK